MSDSSLANTFSVKDSLREVAELEDDIDDEMLRLEQIEEQSVRCMDNVKQTIDDASVNLQSLVQQSSLHIQKLQELLKKKKDAIEQVERQIQMISLSNHLRVTNMAGLKTQEKGWKRKV